MSEVAGAHIIPSRAVRSLCLYGLVRAIANVTKRGRPFTAADVWEHLAAHGWDRGVRATAAVYMSRAFEISKQRRLCRPTCRTQAVRDPVCNRRPQRVWRPA